jgi:4-amino-4-deoxychorismate lyase
MCNIFIVRHRQLLTPALTESGICGVMRDVVMETARAAGIEVCETGMGRDDLASAEEVFLTNSLIGIWPVVRCAERAYGIGEVTREVATALGHRGVEECVA